VSLPEVDWWGVEADPFPPPPPIEIYGIEVDKKSHLHFLRTFDGCTGKEFPCAVGGGHSTCAGTFVELDFRTIGYLHLSIAVRLARGRSAR
jgi:hypothetical protein